MDWCDTEAETPVVDLGYEHMVKFHYSIYIRSIGLLLGEYAIL